MVSVIDLWLPILVSAVAVFFVSSVLHMALPFHRRDLAKLEREAEVLAAFRELAVAPGEYMFPCAPSMKDAGSPEMQEKFQRGPVGLLTIRPPGPWSMGPALGQWFALSLVISLLAGYAASMAFDTSATAMDVFRMIFVVVLAGNGVSSVHNSIWRSVRWSVTAVFLCDAIVYATCSAAIFAWLWPGP